MREGRVEDQMKKGSRDREGRATRRAREQKGMGDKRTAESRLHSTKKRDNE